MKKKSLFLSLILVFCIGLFVSAQKPFAGTVKFSIKAEGSVDPNILAQIPSESEVIIFGNKKKSITNVQEGFGIITIEDGDTKSITVIMEIMGMGKFFLETPAAKIEEKVKNEKFDISYQEEYVTVCGYKCQKAIFKTTDLETDEEQEVILYVSKDLNSGASLNFSEYPGLVGFPLKTEAKIDYEGSEITIVTEASEVTPNKKIKEVDFMLPSDAKNIKENPELMKMLGMGDEEE